jgi:hypothetical protein
MPEKTKTALEMFIDFNEAIYKSQYTSPADLREFITQLWYKTTEDPTRKLFERKGDTALEEFLKVKKEIQANKEKLEQEIRKIKEEVFGEKLKFPSPFRLFRKAMAT